MSKFSVCLIFLILSAATLAQEKLLDENVLLRVRLIDPRLVTHTENQFDVNYNDAKTDLIATRLLTLTESKELKRHLAVDCGNLDDQSLCGHSPMYAVEYVVGSEVKKMITLSGLCGSWASNGEVKVLKGRKSIEYLEKVLPPPDVFRKGATPNNFIWDDMDLAFTHLKRIGTESPTSELEK